MENTDLIPYGRDINDFARNLARTMKKSSLNDVTCPVYVYEETHTPGGDIIFVHRHDLDIDDPSPTYNDRGLTLIGYDIETYNLSMDGEKQTSILSHQFYINHNGQRLGLVLVTNRRFTEASFLRFIDEVLPRTVSRVYLTAHFSIVEGGWLIPSKVKRQTVSGREYETTLVPYRDKKWSGRIWRNRPAPHPDPTGDR